MAARRIDGKAIAEERRAALAARVRQLAAQGRQPRLAAITVAANDAWAKYAKNQAAAAAAVGIAYQEHACPPGTGEAELAEMIEALNADPEVHGIIIQSPLPAGMDDRTAKALIAPAKDVEAVGPARLGQVLAGVPGPAPCTATAAVELAKAALGDLRGVEAVVVGASVIVGKPVAALLVNAGATPTLCHIHTRDLAAHTARADLLVVAVGRPGLITARHVKPGAAVIDVGINRVTGPDGKPRTVGDVDDDVWSVAGAVTPVPGGVGAMTTTILLEATADAAEASGGGSALDAATLLRVLGPAAAGLDARTAEQVARLIGSHLAARGSGMPGSALERRLAAGAVLFDGAMGTELMARGVDPARTAQANLDHPDHVLAIHRAYRAAGAQVAVANTFSANRWRLGGDRELAARLAAAGVRLARQAAEGRQLVLGSLGPSGQVAGAEIPLEAIADAAAEVALAMADAGADGLLIETMPSNAEAMAALAGCRRATRLPVVVSRSLVRDDPAEIAEFARAAEAGGACAVGVNCAAGPRALVPVAARLAASTALPVIARPNAGFPVRAGDAWRYHLTPAWLRTQAEAFLAAGAAGIGGCCGVGPEHIAALADLAGRPRAAAAPAPLPPPAPAAAAAPARRLAATGALQIIAAVPARLAPSEAAAALSRLGGADAVALTTLWPGGPGGARLAARLRHAADASGKPAILELSGIGLREAQEALLAAGLLGIDAVLVDDGVFSGAGASSLELCALADQLRHGRDLAGNRLDAPLPLTVAVRIGQEGGSRAGALARAGADAMVLAPVYEPERFRALMTTLACGPAGHLPVFAELLLLPDQATADELDNEIPALSVPARLKARLREDPDADVRGALRFLAHWRSRLAGVWVALADARTGPAERLLAGLR